ncbi:hypothetical protein EON67_03225 [archaeon]|nr:MAG: hypothetical protein EON67_03225 [archaeon]
MSSALCALLATCVAAAAPERSFHVRRLVSRCDLSRSYAQCTATHNAQAVRESSVYTLAWTAEQAASLAFLQVKDASEAVLPVVKAPHSHNVNGYVLFLGYPYSRSSV